MGSVADAAVAYAHLRQRKTGENRKRPVINLGESGNVFNLVITRR